MSLQPDDQPLEDPQSLPLSQASQLLTSFTQFLTICIHNILYYRSIYPAETFLTSRAYNLPIHQSRHPKVCSWIRDAVDAVKTQLIVGVVERIAVVIYNGQAKVMERWMFDVASFPAWEGFKEAMGTRMDEEEDELDEEAIGNIEANIEGKVNWTDVDEQLRATIRKLAYAAEKLRKLPDGCTFTIAVELRDEGEAPIGVSVFIGTFRYVRSKELISTSILNHGSQPSQIYKQSLRKEKHLVEMLEELRQLLSEPLKPVPYSSNAGWRKVTPRISNHQIHPVNKNSKSNFNPSEYHKQCGIVATS